MSKNLFTESDTDCDESSSSAADEPMDIEPPPAPAAIETGNGNITSQEKLKIFTDGNILFLTYFLLISVRNEPNRKLDHRGNGEFIGALTADNKIVFGMAVLGMKPYCIRHKIFAGSVSLGNSLIFHNDLG